MWLPMQTDIVLTTINARYIHTALGLRYLRANLGEMVDVSTIVEFTTKERPLQMVERLLAHKPVVVGIGVYIWNVDQATQVVQILKAVRPDLAVVIGGPEVSHEWEGQPIFAEADYLVRGEGELAFAELCRALLAGEASKGKVIGPTPPPLDELVLPYNLYSDEDIAHRVLFVESSRGCAFRCQFCLSAIDPRVRPFPEEPFLAALRVLHQRGARRFKFVDRSFNIDLARAERLLDFFLEECDKDCFVHIEVVPDRLPRGLRQRIERFWPGTLQLELGVQTWTAAVARRIGRQQDYARLTDNLNFLTTHTKAHLHADLVIGLPGESLAEIQGGFDALFALHPHEIQVGILKRLRGAPIKQHTTAFDMVYSPTAPYEIMQTSTLDFDQIKELRRFARVWDHLYNRGHFIEAAPLIWAGQPSVFQAFAAFVTWLYLEETTAPLGFSFLAKQLHRYLMQIGHSVVTVDAAVGADYCRVTKRKKLPAIFRSSAQRRNQNSGLPRRQELHQGRQDVSLDGENT